MSLVQLKHKGHLYEFEYDFFPNTGDGDNVVTRLGERWLDGQIVVTDVRINGSPGPVSQEAMTLMRRAAITDYLESQAEAWRLWHQRQQAQRQR